MWDLPGPEIVSVSPALAGEFFTTEPPGKTRNFLSSRKSGLLTDYTLLSNKTMQIIQSFTFIII